MFLNVQAGANGIPRLETARLILRAHHASDLPACAAMWADPEVVRYISGRPSTREQTWARLLRYRGFWALLGYGYWAVVEKTTGAYVGEVGFFDVLREIVPSIEGVPEVGWILATAFHGTGFATEAMKAAITWADEHLCATRTVALIAPENTASTRLAERLGYVVAETTTFAGAATLLLYRDAQSA